MAEKQMNVRIVLKNDTSINWARATNFVPKLGELIIYTDTKQFKIGDGTTTVVNLPFTDAPMSYDPNDDAWVMDGGAIF